MNNNNHKRVLMYTGETNNHIEHGTIGTLHIAFRAKDKKHFPSGVAIWICLGPEWFFGACDSNNWVTIERKKDS
jgi:hypothetical protein